MRAKVHARGTNRVLAACDAELIERTLIEGEIAFIVRKAFYDGEPVDEKALARLLDEHDNINLVGEKTVAVALKKNLVHKDDVRRIQGVPHVQIFNI